VQTEAELKQAQQRHPDGIHLTIADLFGSDSPKYLQQVGGGRRAVVSINGKTSFALDGRSVQLERMEGGAYRPSDIGPIIENELAAK
jgi:hypothetical protein